MAHDDRGMLKTPVKSICLATEMETPLCGWILYAMNSYWCVKRLHSAFSVFTNKVVRLIMSGIYIFLKSRC